MSNPLVRIVIRSLFTLTSRERATRQCREIRERYRLLTEELDSDVGQIRVETPPMLGVDEDMRNWSFFMILEHNTIVNRSITAITAQLARGKPLSGPALIHPKTDVMPSLNPDASQIDAFFQSIDNHLDTVATLGPLRGTSTAPHPVFGLFDAHKWNCMFSFHLGLHYPQAQYVLENVPLDSRRT